MGLQDALFKKLFENLLGHGLTYLIATIEKNEPTFRKKLVEFLVEIDIPFLDEQFEAVADDALREALEIASPKLVQLLIDGLKMLKTAQIKP